MAEALLKRISDKSTCSIESAGIEPGELNQLVVKSMKKIGIDISKNETKSVSSMLKKKKKFDLIIFVCSESQGQSCPTIPYEADKIYWDIKDPSTLVGTDKEKDKEVDNIRDEIEKKVIELIHNKI